MNLLGGNGAVYSAIAGVFAAPPEANDSAAVTSATSISSNFAYEGLTTVLKWIDLNTQFSFTENNSWFVNQYQLMFQVAIWILFPLVLMSLIHAMIKGSLRRTLQAVLVYLPISVVGSVIAIQIVQLTLNVTDDFSHVFMNQLTIDLDKFSRDILIGFDPEQNKTTPAFIVILLGLLTGFASLGLLYILVLREAAIYIATLFMPIMFACLVWPVSRHHFRNMVEFMFSIIFSKLVIVAALSLVVVGLGVSADITNGSQLASSEVASKDVAMPEDQSRAWVIHSLTFALMMLMATFSPALIKGLLGFTGVTGSHREVLAALERPTIMHWEKSYRKANIKVARRIPWRKILTPAR